MNKSIYTIKLLLLLLLITSQQSNAQSSTSWTGATNTTWALSSNWTNGIPDSSKNVIIGDGYFSGVYSPRITAISKCNSLTVGGSLTATLSLAGSLTAFGNVSIQANGTISQANAVLYLKGNWVNDGSYTTSAISSKLSLIGSGIQTVGGNTITTFRSLYIGSTTTMVLSNDIILSGSGSALNVYGEINPGVSTGYKLTSSVSTKINNAAKLKVNKATFEDNYELLGAVALYSGSIVDYASTEVDQTISSVYTYSTLMISGTGVKSLAANLPALYSRNTLSGNIIVSSGTFDLGSYTANRGSYSVGGQISVASGAVIKVNGTSNFPRNYTRKTFSSTSLVNYYGTNQDILDQDYGNLLLSGGGTKNASLSFSVSGDFTLQNCTLNTGINAATISIMGSFIMTGGSVTGTAAIYKMNGTGDQTINVSSSLPNITMDKTGGSLYLGSDLTVSSELLFYGGVIITDNNNLIIGSTGTVTGASQTRGWVNGNLKRMISTGSSVTEKFDVGSADDYTPATILFSSISVGGSIKATTTLNDHPELDYSGINPDKSVNRYWSFVNDAVSFTTANVTLLWAGSDIDGGANTRTFLVGEFNGTSWSKPTISSRVSNSIIATNLTTLDAFAVGEVISAFQWTGNNLTTDWFTDKNWLGGVPTSTSSVTIPNPLGGRRYYPVLTAAQIAQVGDLTIESEGLLTLDLGTIEISGNASSSGTFDASNGTVVFNGSSPQTISSGLFYGNKVKNLTIDNDVTLADTDSLTGTLTIATGKTFSSNDNLVLKSDENGTASIAPLPVNASGIATAYIEGNVSIERYIPARKAWRLLSAPVKSTSAPTICGSWQEGAYGSSFAPNPNPHYGVHITGGALLNGFDQSLTNLPSIKYYNNTTNMFTGLPATPGTLTSISGYDGYMIYIRGDRSIDLMQGVSAAITSTTLRMKGEVKTGSQTTAVNAHNFTVLGNPFPSAINFETLTRSNVKNSFYIWDPKLGGSNGLGGYVTVSYNSGSGSYDVTTASSSISQYIPSGEAVLIESSDGASSGSIVVKESDKTTSGTDFLFGRLNTTSNTIRANLYGIEANGTYSLLDGAMTTYNDRNSNSTTGQDDVTKLYGSSEAISFSRNNRNLAIERRKSIAANDTSFISLTQMKKQNYRLDIVAENMTNENLVAVVMDNYSGITNNLSVDLKGTTHIDFTINNDVASFSPNRFSIVFKVKSATQVSEVKKAEALTSKASAEIIKVVPSAVVYPNPVVSNDINIRFNNMELGAYTLKLYNITGQLVATQSIRYTSADASVIMKVKSGFAVGKYELKIEGQGKSINTSVLKQ